MTSFRTILHRSVVVLFLGLVAGVVYLQVSADMGKPLAASVTEENAPTALPAVCGDKVCVAGETCGNCEIDCGQCKQAYCCQTETHTCDGPFGALNQNPCETAGYSNVLYSFAGGQEEERQAAFDACQASC